MTTTTTSPMPMLWALTLLTALVIGLIFGLLTYARPRAAGPPPCWRHGEWGSGDADEREDLEVDCDECGGSYDALSPYGCGCND